MEVIGYKRGEEVPCYKPLHAYRSFEQKTSNGKPKIFFSRKDAGFSVPIDLPCGQCIGCRVDRSRMWAVRCIHEASMYENNCFITLTFNEENLNKSGTLLKSDFQKFMKRLRRRFKGFESVVDEKTGRVIYPIRYFHCGEYGENFRRPHHHACLFNFDFPDKELWSEKGGNRLYTSEILSKLWPYGYSLIGSVTFQSAAYIASYIIKKVTGERAAEHYMYVNDVNGKVEYYEPEYVTMSRRPGIGYNWFKEYFSDLYPKDFITVDGKKFKVPEYYDRLYDCNKPDDMLEVKKKRKKSLEIHKKDLTDWRLYARNKKKLLDTKQKERSFEDGAADV